MVATIVALLVIVSELKFSIKPISQDQNSGPAQVLGKSVAWRFQVSGSEAQILADKVSGRYLIIIDGIAQVMNRYKNMSISPIDFPIQTHVLIDVLSDYLSSAVFTIVGSNQAGDFIELSVQGARSLALGSELVIDGFGIDGSTFDRELLDEEVSDPVLTVTVRVPPCKYQDSRQQCPLADFSGLNLARSDFRGANLRGVDLTGASLADSRLDRADLSGAIVLNVDFSRSSLIGIDLSDAYVEDVNYSDVVWTP